MIVALSTAERIINATTDWAKFCYVDKLPGTEPKLIKMVVTERIRMSQPINLEHLKRCLWYGSYGVDGKVLAAVGFDEVYEDNSETPWLYIQAIVADRSWSGVKAFRNLLSFVEALPFVVRGLVWSDNPTAYAIALKRGWKHAGVLVEKELP